MSQKKSKPCEVEQNSLPTYSMQEIRQQFGHHFERYAELRKVELNERSLETERDINKSLWKYLLMMNFQGDELEVTREDLMRYAEFTFKRKDLKRNSAIHLVRVLKNFYNEAHKQEWICDNPYRGIHLPKEEENLINVLSVKQMKKLLELPDLLTAHGIQARAIMELMYSCALRSSEVINLKQESFSEDYRTLTLTGKGSKTAAIPVGRVAAHCCKFWIEQVLPQINEHNIENVFLSLKTKKEMGDQTLWGLIRTYTKQILPDQDIGTHFFRYSAISHLADEGVDVRVLMCYARHARLHTTMKYIKQSFQKLQEVFRETHPRS